MSPTAATACLGGVLFDLDGTLVDTAADIALALNAALAEFEVAPLEERRVRDLIGRGAAVLIERALAQRGVDADAALRERVFARFLAQYHHLHHAGHSTAQAYPGAFEGLSTLRARGLKLAVVTNKQRSLAILTLRHAGLAPLFELVVGGDTCAERKPRPEPLLHAGRALGFAPAALLMVGDSANDVTAARAAGMPVWCVPYGYNEGVDPRSLPCDRFVESLAELPACVAGGPWAVPDAAPAAPGAPDDREHVH